ncbi:MAG: aminotransferase class I/II-fold pyridoxal phosphate-dependent enzyme, partial [Gaiella sp.]
MAPISFARGAPTPECLDPELIAECATAALERDGATILSYGQGGGYGPLRELLGERHGVDPNRIFLTTGGLQGFVFFSAVQLARKPGRVLVEAPTYDRPLKLLGWQGAEVVPLAMDEEGLDPDALEAELDRGGEISFLYTIPTFQNPSGRTLGVDRRRRIAELVVAHELDVLEDDPYGLVRYEGVAPLSLHELEGGRRVSFTSSFSKTAAPGLRVGWFVVPDA